MTPKPKQAVAAIKGPVAVESRHHDGLYHWQVTDDDGIRIARCDTEDQARQIAHALNSLPGLVEAAKEVIEDSECYCADNVAVNGPCGWCKFSAIVTAAEKGMV